MTHSAPPIQRPRAAPLFWARLALASAALIGCQSVLEKPPEAAMEQLLRPVTTSPDSVTLEIFHARIPLEEDARADALWNEVDEQCFPAELRDKLVANGLRAGVVGGTLPSELASLLELESDMPAATSQRVITASTAVPQVTRRVVQVNRREPTAIKASEVQGEADVLVSEGGLLRGQTFHQVEAIYSLRAEAVDGQRVQVRLIPELDHGDLRTRYAGSDQGIFLMTPSREREVYDQLSMEATLLPGEVLVLGALPDAKASLGGVFHAAHVNGRNERKLILIRLLEAPRSEILAKN